MQLYFQRVQLVFERSRVRGFQQRSGTGCHRVERGGGQFAHLDVTHCLLQPTAQIGQIKEVTEDPESGSLTIKVEV